MDLLEAVQMTNATKVEIHGGHIENDEFIVYVNGTKKGFKPKKGSVETLRKGFYERFSRNPSEALMYVQKMGIGRVLARKGEYEEPDHSQEGQDVPSFKAKVDIKKKLKPKGSVHPTMRPGSSKHVRAGHEDSAAKTNDAIQKKHNQRAYKEACEVIDMYGTCCVVQATGTGKSSVFTSLIDDYSDQTCVFVSPSVQINEQMKGYNKDNPVGSNLHTITYQSILSGAKEEPPFMKLKTKLKDVKVGLLCLDELHRAGAPEWKVALELFRQECCDDDTIIVGASATPKRADGSDPSEELCGGHSVSNLSLEDAIAQDILPMPDYYNVPQVSKEDIKAVLDGVDVLEPEFRKKAKEELQSIMGKFTPEYQAEKDKLFIDKISSIIEKKNAKGEGIKILGFAADIDDAKTGTGAELKRKLAAAFPGKKIIIDTCVSGDKKKTFVEDFKNKPKVKRGEIHILMTVNMFNEGLHCKGVDTIVMGRPTKSDVIYSQQVGRVLSVDDEQEATIFDFCNNSGESKHQWESIHSSYKKAGSPRGEKEVVLDHDYQDALRQADYCLSSFKQGGKYRYGKIGDTYTTFDEEYKKRGMNPSWKKTYDNQFRIYIDRGMTFEEAFDAL